MRKSFAHFGVVLDVSRIPGTDCGKDALDTCARQVLEDFADSSGPLTMIWTCEQTADERGRQTCGRAHDRERL